MTSLYSPHYQFVLSREEEPVARKNNLRKLLLDNAHYLHLDLDRLVTEIPKATCDCGKPVVFASGKRRFSCSRCGANYQLIVKIKKTSDGAANR